LKLTEKKKLKLEIGEIVFCRELAYRQAGAVRRRSTLLNAFPASRLFLYLLSKKQNRIIKKAAGFHLQPDNFI
jgi:hypothetical protein